MTDQNSLKNEKISKVNNRWLASVKDLPPNEAFQFLKNCNCCEHHKVDRPQELVLWCHDYNEKQIAYNYKTQPKQCLCDCRALSRMLCRGQDISVFKVVE